MGEAKSRGSQQDRVAAAQQSATAAQPPAMFCQRCKLALNPVTEMDTRRLKGISVAYSAHCVPCDEDTWAVRGDIAAVKAFYAALEKASGQAVQMGTAKPRPL